MRKGAHGAWGPESQWARPLPLRHPGHALPETPPEQSETHQGETVASGSPKSESEPDLPAGQSTHRTGRRA